jgi:hypothetical protein
MARLYDRCSTPSLIMVDLFGLLVDDRRLRTRREAL